jgi:hypothetical protein
MTSFDLERAGGVSSQEGIERAPLWVAGVSYIAAALFGLIFWIIVIRWCL